MLPTPHPRSRNFMQRSYTVRPRKLISWSRIESRRPAMPPHPIHNVGYELARTPLLRRGWANNG
jgi:hypothetical protein